MNKKLLFVLFLLVLSSPAFADKMMIDQYLIPSSYVDSGGSSGESSLSPGVPSFEIFGAVGEPAAGTCETTGGTPNYLLKAGFIYTLGMITVEVKGAPTIEGIRVNDVGFADNDIVAPTGKIELKLADSEGVASAYLMLDGIQRIDFALESGQSTFEGWWEGTTDYAVSTALGNPHTLYIYRSDSSKSGKFDTKHAQVLGGSVKVVGKPLNYPNPFKPLDGGVTRIQYELTVDAPITIILYDITGREIKRMGFRSGQRGGQAGMNSVDWDGKTIFREVAGNGMYIYKIISGTKVLSTGKLVVLD